MAMIKIKESTPASALRAALVIGVFAGTAGLGACSQVPDAVNPASWYRNTVDFFAGEKKDDKKAEEGGGLKADRGKAPPGAEKAFPNLASVDEKAAARGLSADPDRPKYAPAIQRQGDAPAALPPEKPAEVAAAAPGAKPVMPPPAAAPTTPVTPAPAPPPAAAQMPSPPAAQPMPMPAMPEAAPPMTATPEQKDAEARLTQRLAEIRSRAEQQAELAQRPPLTAAPAPGETIVVSSAGIETQGGAAEMPPTVSIPPAPGAAVEPSAAAGPSALPVPADAARVATILFGNGSAALRARDKTILGAVSRLQRQKGGVIRVVGHASARTRNLPPIKRKMVNFKVSIDRADSIAAELARLGVARENILVAAVSDTEPQYYEFMPSGEAGNRRAEIYLSN